MNQKKFNSQLITLLVFTCISFGNVIRLRGIENVRAIHVVSLLTLGFGLGASVVTIIQYFKNKNSSQL